MEGTDPWIHRPPSVISISIAKLTKISTDLILRRIILFRDKVMRMVTRHIQKKSLPSESYSAVDYRIGRIVSWGRCDKRNKQKNPLRSLPLYDESSLDYEYIHPIKWIPEISLSVLTLSLLLAIRWRTMIISELRRIIGWFWVAQAKKCILCTMYVRKKHNRSGSTSVVVVSKVSGKYREIKSGSSEIWSGA